jgi:hypothetical protein
MSLGRRKPAIAVFGDRRLTRRRLIGAALTFGAAVPARAEEPLAKVSQNEAAYQNIPNGLFSCAACSFFIRPRSCKVVTGDISPSGWCNCSTCPIDRRPETRLEENEPALLATVLMAVALPALAQEAAKPNTNWPGYQEGDYVVRDYKFVSGESLPEVKLHYRTIGTAKRNAAGEVINGVLLLQGNTGTGANWFRPTLAHELFKPGQPLDPAKYYIIMPDALGRGGSSKPSDGLKGKLPHYRYRDMVDLTHRLVTEGLKAAHLRLIIGSSLGCMQQFLWAEWLSRFDGRHRRAVLPAGRD